MNRPPFLWFLACLMLGACSEESTGPEPTVCVTMMAVTESPSCAYMPRLVFDASCSSDDETPSDLLTVRWDFQSDGTWDTGFTATGSSVTYWLEEVVAGGEWNVRCEVRDTDGLSTIRIMALDLPGNLAKPPDVIVSEFKILAADYRTAVDTMRIGEDFYLFMTYDCVASFDQGFYQIQFWQDDLLLEELNFRCNTWKPHYCYHFPRKMTILTPGRYTFRVIVNGDHRLPETDYSNNQGAVELEIVP